MEYWYVGDQVTALLDVKMEDRCKNLKQGYTYIGDQYTREYLIRVENGQYALYYEIQALFDDGSGRRPSQEHYKMLIILDHQKYNRFKP